MKKTNQTEEAFRRLRDDIVQGVLQPNQRLVESRLVITLGMSRTPIREALRELLTKGYVSRLGNGGLIVIDQSQARIRNLHEIREALETKAITLACQRITPVQIREADRYQLEYSKAADDQDIDQTIKMNAAFHDTLLAGCGNEQLLSILATIRDQYLDRRVLLRFTAKNWKTIVNQHAQLLKAVQDHNANQARRVIRDHLKTFTRIALEKL